MRRVSVFVLSILLLFPLHGFAMTIDVKGDKVNKIIELMDNQVTKEFVMDQLEDIMKSTGISLEEAADAVYKELLIQHELAQEEEKMNLQGPGGGGTTVIGSSSAGNIFYETASTSGIQHGHVGIYYSTSTLVESLPSTGVRRIARTNKQVASGARIQSVSSTTATQKTNAANWANGRVGEKYSYNFFNNRSTSCVGDKNCSKLVWCAYNITMSLDLDANGGLGVYPKDIRDHSRVLTLVYY